MRFSTYLLYPFHLFIVSGCILCTTALEGNAFGQDDVALLDFESIDDLLDSDGKSITKGLFQHLLLLYFVRFFFNVAPFFSSPRKVVVEKMKQIVSQKSARTQARRRLLGGLLTASLLLYFTSLFLLPASVQCPALLLNRLPRLLKLLVFVVFKRCTSLFTFAVAYLLVRFHFLGSSSGGPASKKIVPSKPSKLAGKDLKRKMAASQRTKEIAAAEQTVADLSAVSSATSSKFSRYVDGFARF